MRGLRFELSACRNTELNFEFCCAVRVSAFPRFGECCVARFLLTHSILSALYFSSPSTTSAVLRWLVMLVLSNLYRCMFIEFYFLSKFSNSIKRLTHKRNGAGCPSAASLSSSFARQILSILFDSSAVHSCSVHFNAGNFISEECHAFPPVMIIVFHAEKSNENLRKNQKSGTEGVMSRCRAYLFVQFSQIAA